MGIRDRPISPRSPWQNPYAERLIGTLRRDCLDHVLIFGERHLRGVLTLYSLYYNETRTHLGLGKDAPLRRAVHRSGASRASLVRIASPLRADMIFGKDSRKYFTSKTSARSFTFVKPNLMLPVGTTSFPVPRKWLPVTSLLARKNSLIDIPGNSSLRALKFLQHCAGVFMKLAGFPPISPLFPDLQGISRPETR